MPGVKNHYFDAIIIGSGISGGWAAKELCESGLKTLLIDRGRNVQHIKDYTTAFKQPWEFEHRLMLTTEEQNTCPVQSLFYDEGDRHFYVNDKEHPYIQEDPFHWVRGYQVGGRSLTWGRQCYRLSDLDFEANLKDGIGVDWPIRYKEIEPWYNYVESYIGLSGRSEGLNHLPDGVFLPPVEMNCLEDYFSIALKRHYNDRVATPSRIANLTRGWKGRGPCQYRNLCSRGCPYNGFFSSNGVTIPAAAATGNLTLLADTLATEIIYDKVRNRASGIRVLNTITKESSEYFVKLYL